MCITHYGKPREDGFSKIVVANKITVISEMLNT